MGTNRSRRSRGFTLVEILCVVIIVGIAGAIIVPQIGSRNDMRVASAARMVMADLIYAQNRAITFQSTQCVRLETGSGRYRLLSTPGLTPVEHPINQTDYVVQFGSGALSECALAGARVTGASGATYEVLAFDDLGTPLGYNVSGGGTEQIREAWIDLRCGDDTLRLNVEPFTGHVTVTSIP